MRGLWIVVLVLIVILIGAFALQPIHAEGVFGSEDFDDPKAKVCPSIEAREIILVGCEGQKCKLSIDDKGALVVDAIRAESVMAKSVTARSGDNSVVMTATAGIAGVWCNRTGSSKYVTIYNSKEQGPVVAVGDPNHGGYPYAVSVDENNKAHIQHNPGLVLRRDSTEK